MTIVALFVGLLLGGLFLILDPLTADPRDATTGYFAAVVARDWAGAHDRLSAAQRDRIRPEDLAALWEAREGARGPTEGFRVMGVKRNTVRTRVSGTLRYRDGATESRTVWLVEEGGAWKIASDP